ncbi:hypothetical protein IMG5_076200, partial [Ichthyophthirius multifiliis]
MFIICIIFIVIISIIDWYTNPCYTCLMKNKEEEINIIYVIFSYVNDYMLFFPQILYFIYDSITFSNSILQNYQYNKNKLVNENMDENSKDNQNFFINSQKEIAELYLTTHCFIDKTCILEKNKQFEICKMYLQGSSYQINKNNINNKKDNCNKDNDNNDINSNNENNNNDENNKNNNNNDIDNQNEKFNNKKIQNNNINNINNNNNNNNNNIDIQQRLFQFKKSNSINNIIYQNQTNLINDAIGDELYQYKFFLPNSQTIKKKKDIEYQIVQNKNLNNQTSIITNITTNNSSMNILFQKNQITLRNNFIKKKSISNCSLQNQSQKIQNINNLYNHKYYLSLISPQIKDTASLAFIDNLEIINQFQKEIQENSVKDEIKSNVNICNLLKGNINDNNQTQQNYLDNNNSEKKVLKFQILAQNLFLNMHNNIESSQYQQQENQLKQSKQDICYKIEINDQVSPLRKLTKKQSLMNLYIPQNSLNKLKEEIISESYLLQKQAIITLAICHISRTVLNTLNGKIERLKEQLQYMIEKGLIGIIFCRKNISWQTADMMIEKYGIISKNLNSEDRKINTYLLFKEQLNEMNFISLFSVKQILNMNAQSLIQNLKNAQINTFLITGDSSLRALAVGYETGLFSGNDIISFESYKQEELKYQMNVNLKKIREKILYKKQEITKKVNQKYKQMYIFYILKNKQKQNKKEQIYTLAIGKGINNTKIMQNADFSIQYETISEQNQNNVLNLFSCIKVSKLSTISYLLYSFSRNACEIVEDSFNFIFYRHLFLLFLVFLWNFGNCSFGDIIFDFYDIVQVNISLVIILLSFLVRKKYIVQKHETHILTYVKQFKQKKIFFIDILQNFFLLILPQTLVDVFILFYLLFYSINQTVLHDGIIFEKQQIVFIIKNLFLFLNHYKIILYQNQSNKTLILNIIFPTLFLIRNSFGKFYDMEFSMFYSLNMSLIVLVILLNFSISNFLMRLISPLISFGMMKNKNRFQEIYQQVLQIWQQSQNNTLQSPDINMNTILQQQQKEIQKRKSQIYKQKDQSQIQKDQSQLQKEQSQMQNQVNQNIQHNVNIQYSQQSKQMDTVQLDSIYQQIEKEKISNVKRKIKKAALAQVFKLIFKDNEVDNILQDLNSENFNINATKMHPLFLTFPSKETEGKFVQQQIQKNRKFYMISSVLIVLFGDIIIAIFNQQKMNISYLLIVSKCGIDIFLWIILIYSQYNLFTQINYMIFFLRFLYRLVFLILMGEESILQTMFYSLLFSYSILVSAFFQFFIQFALVLAHIVQFIIQYLLQNTYQQDIYFQLYIILNIIINNLLFTGLIFKMKYQHDIQKRKNFQHVNTIFIETKKQIMSYLFFYRPSQGKQQMKKEKNIKKTKETWQFCFAIYMILIPLFKSSRETLFESQINYSGLMTIRVIYTESRKSKLQEKRIWLLLVQKELNNHKHNFKQAKIFSQQSDVYLWLTK